MPMYILVVIVALILVLVLVIVPLLVCTLILIVFAMHSDELQRDGGEGHVRSAHQRPWVLPREGYRAPRHQTIQHPPHLKGRRRHHQARRLRLRVQRVQEEGHHQVRNSGLHGAGDPLGKTPRYGERGRGAGDGREGEVEVGGGRGDGRGLLYVCVLFDLPWCSDSATCARQGGMDRCWVHQPKCLDLFERAIIIVTNIYIIN